MAMRIIGRHREAADHARRAAESPRRRGEDHPRRHVAGAVGRRIAVGVVEGAGGGGVIPGRALGCRLIGDRSDHRRRYVDRRAHCKMKVVGVAPLLPRFEVSGDYSTCTRAMQFV